ncbi:MAG TPA: BamA/TamA family outer membrane protein [Vicinamibacterales bacterium]|nr:BamA/TamA family outer membrane protein [Vicinamibacterales bacterium]
MKGQFLVTALCLLLTAPAVASAQGTYFGQNKVQYRSFDFRVLKTDHFDIYYYPEEQAAARMAARMAERWYTRISTILDHQLRGRQPLILYASGSHFRQTNAIMGDIGEGTGGVTEAFKRRIVLPFAGPIEATDHVLGHELVHAFQYDITGTNVSAGTAGALGLPLWFIEGMAEYLSVGPVDPHTAMWMREAARRERLPDIDDLDNPRYFPYRYGQALWAYIAGRYGDEAVGLMLRAAAGRQPSYVAAIEGILQTDTKTLSREWHAAVFDAYRPIAEASRLPADIARPLIHREKQGGGTNVSPELSPDGSRLVFFSERDLFSIDLYLADARTGEIIRKITDTATDPHYETLQFLSSTGAWDRDGKRFVFPGISRGQAVLTIVDVDSGRREREIRIEAVDEIVNPAWSPDGRAIAFSGMSGGFTDLFVWDLEANALKRLTEDAFADMEPDWSPDGRLIAFSTDRFTTDLDRVSSGPLRLGIVDVGSGGIRELGGFADAKNTGPQWTPDGRALYFLSDREGVTNVYRMDVDGGQTRQVTNLLTGASGITALSPAMSYAGGRLVFSAYEDDGYNIYAIESDEQLAGGPLVELPRNAAVLPPRRTGQGPVFNTVNNPTLGLSPAPPADAATEYSPRLSLDYAGQPTVGVGADSFGAYAAGSVAFLFSDMLGNHTVGTAAQVTSRFDEFGGSLFYLNRTRRWNWGVSLDQTPYVARGFEAGVANVDGQNVYVEREYRVIQQDTALTGLIAYPFSRASRVELTGGFRRIGLSEDLTTRLYALSTGQQIFEEEEELGSLPTLSFGQTAAALVYDTSIFGATGPIRGSRHRLELSQTAGSLTYTGVLADLRTYQMPFRPYTFAFRAMYYGRLGRDAEDGRLPTLFLGYPGLVRGYQSESFETGECGVQPDGSCPAFDRLVGSRIAVANAELRVPIWGAFGGSGFYGPLPVEMVLFSDAGVAWGRSERSGFAAGDNKPVVSVGAALRGNVFGFAVAEINYVRPLDRPGRGWLWQFNLRPAF